MILVDVNLLIYAINEDSHHHAASKQWLEETLSGTTAIGLPWIVILAFLRITTHPKIFATPIASQRAISILECWLNQPYVQLIGPGEKHWPILRQILQSAGTAGNLTSDAHIAALAIEKGCDIYSADHDFKRFSGIHHINPIEKK